MKVHVTLIGRQTAPAYNCIMHFNPDKVFYIYSPETRGELSVLQSLVSIPYEAIEVSASDLSDIRTKAIELSSRLVFEDEVTVNLQGGTKHWSLIFYSAFSQMTNCSMYLIDQNNIMSNLNNLENHVIDSDVFSYFYLTGNPPQGYTDFAEYDEEDLKSMKIISNARRHDIQKFNTLAALLKDEWAEKLRTSKHGIFKADDYSYIKWDKSDTVQKVEIVLDGKKFYLSSPHAVSLTFNSGWFEYKVARMLSHWCHAEKILLNCVFPPKTNPSEIDLRYPKNEVDIIVFTKKKALFVECKTKLHNSTDIDKFRTVVRNYGGQSSKALFITDRPMLPLQKEKCSESAIITFSIADSGPNKEQELFRILNAELSVINK